MSLKEIRKQAGLTQTQLAEVSGLCWSQVQKIESGAIKIENITLKNAAALAKALGVKIEDLLD